MKNSRLGVVGLLSMVGVLFISSLVSATPITAETITVAPAVGPAGTVFTVTGTNFPPGWATARLNISIRAAQPAPPPTVVGSVEIAVSENGEFQAQVNSFGLLPSQYIVFVWSQNIPDRVIAETTITITPADQPTLPTTGGGGMASSPRLPPWSMDVAIVNAFLRAFVGCILLLAALGKFLDARSTHRAVVHYGVPTPWASLVARTLPFLEFALGTVLVLQLLPLFSPLGAALMLMAFLGVVLRVFVRGQVMECHCFGALSREMVSLWTVARLAVLLLLTGAVAVIDLSVVLADGLLLVSPLPDGGVQLRVISLVVASLAAVCLMQLGQVIATFRAMAQVEGPRRSLDGR